MPDADSPRPYDLRPALLATLLALGPAPLYVLDDALRVLWSHGATDGATADGSPVGRPFTSLYDFDDPDQVAHLLRHALSAEPPTRTADPQKNPTPTFRGRRPAPDRTADAPGPPGHLDFTAHRLAQPAAGGPHLGPGPGRPDPPALLVVVDDPTGLDRSRAQHAALAAVREHVGRSLDVTRTCRDLAEALVPGFADIAVVDVVDDVLRGSEPPEAALGPGMPLRCAAVRLEDAAMEPPCLEGSTHVASLRTPQARALTDLEPRLLPVDGESPWLSATPEHARAVREDGAHSLLLVPLALRGTVLGVLSLYRCGPTPAFHASDVSIGAALGAHAALSLDNARRYARDHTIASTVQRHLLPQRATRTPALETAHAYLPGRGSGCWFDTIRLPGGRTALVVGDVAGQGIETAATMGQLRMVINALADLDLEPAELLARLEGTAARLAHERDAASGALPDSALPGTALPVPGGALAPAGRGGSGPQPLLASCLYGVFDPFTRTCVVAGAGPLVPLVVDPEGQVLVPDLPTGPPLGSGEPLPHAEVSVELPEGGVLAFRTGAFAAPAGHDGTDADGYDAAAAYDPAVAYGLDDLLDDDLPDSGDLPGDEPPDGPPDAATPGARRAQTPATAEPVRTAALRASPADPAADPVRAALARPGQSLREMCDAAVYALPPAGEQDGAVLLLARATQLPRSHCAEADLPDSAAASAQARVATRRALGRWHADRDTLEAAELIVSELVTNAVRYGAPPVRLRLLNADGTLTCEVHDSGTAAPHLRHARTADEGGRGLFIVSQLATRWGTRHAAAGKVLWTEQPLHRADEVPGRATVPEP